MAQENFLQIQQMLANMDEEKMADLLMRQAPGMDPTVFLKADQKDAPSTPTNADMFAAAIANPESGLQTPQAQLPAPHLFGFGNAANPQVVSQATGQPQIRFRSLFGG